MLRKKIDEDEVVTSFRRQRHWRRREVSEIKRRMRRRRRHEARNKLRTDRDGKV